MKRISLLCILTIINIIITVLWAHSQNFEKQLLASSCLCPTVRMEQLGSHWADFHKIWYLNIFRKSVEKIQISLKSDKIDGTLHECHCTFFIIYRSFRFRMMFQTKVLETIKTHILYSIFFFENRAVYKIMWENIVELGRTQMTIWCMRTACWIPKSANTHWDYVIVSTTTTVTRTRFGVILYVHCLSC
jgi:hypothetical protein